MQQLPHARLRRPCFTHRLPHKAPLRAAALAAPYTYPAEGATAAAAWALVQARMRALSSWTHRLQRPRCSSGASPYEAAQPPPAPDDIPHRRSCGASLAAPSLLCSRRARCCCTGSGRSLAAPRAQRPDTRGAQGLPGTQVAPASRKHTAYMKCISVGTRAPRTHESKSLNAQCAGPQRPSARRAQGVLSTRSSWHPPKHAAGISSVWHVLG